MERKPLKAALAYGAATKELAVFLKDRNVAVEIGRLYARSNECLADAVAARLECGRLLIEQKDSLPHGEWLPWLKANAKTLGFSSERTAQMLMKGAANTKLASHLTEAEALKLSQELWGHDREPKQIAKPKKEKPYGETYISPDIDEEDVFEGTDEEYGQSVREVWRLCRGLEAFTTEQMPVLTADQLHEFVEAVNEAIDSLLTVKRTLSPI